jgi:hypothetical protein
MMGLWKPETLYELHRAWTCEYCKHENGCRDTARDENCVFSAKPELIEEFSKAKAEASNKGSC